MIRLKTISGYHHIRPIWW